MFADFHVLRPHQSLKKCPPPCFKKIPGIVTHISNQYSENYADFVYKPSSNKCGLNIMSEFILYIAGIITCSHYFYLPPAP